MFFWFFPSQVNITLAFSDKVGIIVQLNLNFFVFALLAKHFTLFYLSELTMQRLGIRQLFHWCLML